MTAETVLCRARELGISLTLNGDKIRYTPKTVPPDFLDALRQHKPEVMAYLEHRQSHCRACLCDNWREFDGVECHICDGSICADCQGCLNASIVWRIAQGLVD